ncbi:BRCA1-A complex subunit RAP80 isoform X4 [Ascaphus truei]|uniref:BRCA1-A complex subunit RAP80 isoform X4 n=1 Tax=Ascaphus truei TaxID=8439 RepID=UPI003F59A0BC
MPRKRRKSHSEEARGHNSPNEEDRGEDGRSEGSDEKKQITEEPFIVISDSDGEDAKEENGLPKKRNKLALERRRTVEKKGIAHMTEEEQLALAVKMSEQEANHVNYSQEEEEALLKKAIEESLHCCGALDPPERLKVQEMDNEKPLNKEDIGSKDLGKELSQHSDFSEQAIPKSPVVRLTRLSQDIVESSSIILSPNNGDLLSRTSGVASLCLSDTSDFVPMSPAKALARSPVFPKRFPCEQRLVPRKLFGTSQSPVRLVQKIDDQHSHCSESSQQDSAPVISNLLPCEPLKQESAPRTQEVSEKNSSCDGNTTRLEAADSAPLTTSQNPVRDGSSRQNESAVHYYWGIPFCPKGEDPNAYTQVILCQLEVYQKSLKRAQRRLLRKMDFGEPVQLAAPSLRRSERGKGDSQGSCSQDDPEEVKDDDDDDDEDDDDDCAQRPVEGAEDSGKSATRRVSNRTRQLFESPAHSPQKEESSMPSQDEPAPSYSQSSQTRFTDVMPGEFLGATPAEVCKSAVSPTAEGEQRSPVVETEDVQEEEEITVCPETQPSPAGEEVPDSKEKSRIPSVTPAEQAASLEPSCLQHVECPLCGQLFSATQIEIHAAYCDGTSKDDDKRETSVLTRRKKIAMRSLAGPADLLPSPDTGNSCLLHH